MAIWYDSPSGYCRDCGRECDYHALNRCRWCYEKATKPYPSSINIEKQIELSKQQTMELMAKKEAMEQFGKDEDYDVDDAILFKRKFTGSKVYTYVAVKTPIGWYITGKSDVRWSWETLVEQHLMLADEVWNCTEWTQVI